MLFRQLSQLLPRRYAVFASSPAAVPRSPRRPCLPPGSRLLVTDRLRSRINPQQAADKPARERQERGLATAVDGFGLSVMPDQLPPWEIRSFDPSNPLVVKRMDASLRRQRVTPGTGIPGDPEDLFPYFEVCIATGKLDRAAMSLKRLMEYADTLPKELILLHNAYLRAFLDQLRQSPDQRLRAEELHVWYETHIRSRHLPQTAETIACMVKATLLSETGARKKQLVSRYMSMATGQFGYDVLGREDIIGDQDLAEITRICPWFNIVTTEVEEGGDEPSPPRKRAELDLAALPGAGEDLVAEVLPTPQKGAGLVGLKRALNLFDSVPQSCDFSNLPLKTRLEIQSRLELDCVDAAINRWRQDVEKLQHAGITTATGHPTLKSRMFEWHSALVAEIKNEITLADEAERNGPKSMEDYDRCLYGPFLKQADIDRIAAVTLISVMSSGCVTGIDKGVPLTQAIASLAKSVEEDIRLQKSKAHADMLTKLRRRRAQDPSSLTPEEQETLKKAEDARVAYRAQLEARSLNPDGTPIRKTRRSKNRSFMTPAEAVINSPYDPERDRVHPEEEAAAPPRGGFGWPDNVRLKVGAALLSALIRTAQVKVVKENEDGYLLHELQPAFAHTGLLRKGKKLGALIMHGELVKIFKQEPPGDILAKHLPMIVRPRPWRKQDDGAFFESRVSMVRFKHGDRDQRIYTDAAIERGDMNQVLGGLDVLGKTAWRINRPVFDIMLEAWNTGEPIANLPPLNPDIPSPPEPETLDPAEKRRWMHTVKAVENEKSGLHSVRCFINFQLEIAKAFRNQTFYFPHNLDFRGRAYPMPTYLNHMGADHVRGLLRFADGKALGERGLKWLKVHVANVYGYDKASLEEREAFADANMDKILDSAAAPLGGTKWWMKAEDPWQTLAACFELRAAVESANPTAHVSYLPIHQDGTCNGLQHYAALGGDEWGARQVNLEPGEKPADVYTAVADLVKTQVAADARANNPIALALDGKVTRKVVKQTVMTNVYGVTFSGARAQVRKQLDDLYPDLYKQCGIPHSSLAYYIACLIFSALSNMFSGAHDIQKWLGNTGGRICTSLTPEQLDRIAKGVTDPNTPAPKARKSKSKAAQAAGGDGEALPPAKPHERNLPDEFQNTIVWTTPLCMPVSQPYRRHSKRIISTCLQRVHLTVPEPTDPVNRRKQLQAFPPNFIHSLDASHMLLSALECDSLGLSFAAVHDSFWTHACDVDVMNRVLRDAFVRIHREDVIGRLRLEFQARYADSLYQAKISDKTGAAAAIKDWRKHNKMPAKEELLLEYERQNLLRSEDPEERARGENMTTPARLYEQLHSSEDEDLTNIGDLQGTGIGEVSDVEVSDVEVSDEDGEHASAFVEGEDGDHAAADEEGEDGFFGDDHEESTESGGSPSNGTAQNKFRTAIGNKSVAKKAPTYVSLWLPLTFPEAPVKGSFDVERLRESKYFFS